MSKLVVSIDVEPDLHTGRFLGVTQGLKKAEKIFDKHQIKPILFVTCDCLQKHPGYFRKLKKKGWEISLHGYRHKRFDDLSKNEKEEQISMSLECFHRHLGDAPKGFRAPQHSIDDETLDILEERGFEYDSSSTPRNLLQLLFFPKKAGLWFKSFFSPVDRYKVRENLEERPASSFLVPFVSLPIRISYTLSRILYFFLKTTRKEVIFYCHSWDFIRLPKSRVDRIFNHKRLIKNLDKLLEKIK